MSTRLLYAACAALWLLLSAVIAVAFAGRDVLSAEQEFNSLAQRLSDQLEQKLLASDSVLDSYATLSQLDGQHNSLQERQFVRQVVRRYPHIAYLQRIEHVTQADLPQFRQRFTLQAFARSGRELTSALPNKTDYFPLVFLEPASPQLSRLVGVDIATHPLMTAALQQAISSGRSASSDPFEGLDGVRSYLLVRPAADSMVNAASGLIPPRFVSLLVRTNALQPDAKLLPSGMVVRIERQVSAAHPGHLVVQSGHAVTGWLERLLFPRLQTIFPLGGEAQPLVMTVSWQLGWAQIGMLEWSMMLLLSLLVLGLIVVAVYSYGRFNQNRAARESRLFYLANHDRLTGLANRSLFYDRLQHAISRFNRSGKRLAVLFMDMDRFKPVNDTYGHATGDRVLKLIAERIKTELRTEDTVARLGGDEFVAMLEDVESHRQADKVVERLRAAIERPYELDGHTIYLGVSIGIAYYPEDGLLIDELLEVADRKMYGNKSAQA
ncbi:MAG TPA: sensor domain-containing diguanylate cyclase [Chromobacteriaceae bacterium]|nr:sensor domain-containing diguanylate cyclase [Chromobacteriaceae bacterium]